MDGDCPLCCNRMDDTDLSFYPCPCGYQICLYCYNRLLESEMKRCPACRTDYKESTQTFKEKKKAGATAERKKKVKKATVAVASSSASAGPSLYDTGPHPVPYDELSEIRVRQKNLVYVVGLPSSLCDESLLRTDKWFGRFGKIKKLYCNSSKKVLHSSRAASYAAFVTFHRERDALAAIGAVNGLVVDGKMLRATTGSTKYCTYFLRRLSCSNPSCLYLHDWARHEDVVSKNELNDFAPVTPKDVGDFLPIQSPPTHVTLRSKRHSTGVPVKTWKTSSHYDYTKKHSHAVAHNCSAHSHSQASATGPSAMPPTTLSAFTAAMARRTQSVSPKTARLVSASATPSVTSHTPVLSSATTITSGGGGASVSSRSTISISAIAASSSPPGLSSAGTIPAALDLTRARGSGPMSLSSPTGTRPVVHESREPSASASSSLRPTPPSMTHSSATSPSSRVRPAVECHSQATVQLLADSTPLSVVSSKDSTSVSGNGGQVLGRCSSASSSSSASLSQPRMQYTSGYAVDQRIATAVQLHTSTASTPTMATTPSAPTTKESTPTLGSVSVATASDMSTKSRSVTPNLAPVPVTAMALRSGGIGSAAVGHPLSSNTGVHTITTATVPPSFPGAYALNSSLATVREYIHSPAVLSTVISPAVIPSVALPLTADVYSHHTKMSQKVSPESSPPSIDEFVPTLGGIVKQLSAKRSGGSIFDSLRQTQPRKRVGSPFDVDTHVRTESEWEAPEWFVIANYSFSLLKCDPQ